MSDRADRAAHEECDRRYDAVRDALALVLIQYDRLHAAHLRLLRAMREAVHIEETGPSLPTPQQLKESAG